MFNLSDPNTRHVYDSLGERQRELIAYAANERMVREATGAQPHRGSRMAHTLASVPLALVMLVLRWLHVRHSV